MENISERRNCFFIDVTRKKVFCMLCKGLCRSLVLPRVTHFWCATRGCRNSADVRLYPDGTWEVFTFVEHWMGNRTSEIVPKRIHAIRPRARV